MQFRLESQWECAEKWEWQLTMYNNNITTNFIIRVPSILYTFRSASTIIKCNNNNIILIVNRGTLYTMVMTNIHTLIRILLLFISLCVRSVLNIIIIMLVIIVVSFSPAVCASLVNYVCLFGSDYILPNSWHCTHTCVWVYLFLIQCKYIYIFAARKQNAIFFLCLLAAAAWACDFDTIFFLVYRTTKFWKQKRG